MTKEECEVETSKAIMEMRNHIEELEKENAKLQAKIDDWQSEYIELENFKNNEIAKLKAQIEKMKCCENCKHHCFWGNELNCRTLSYDEELECMKTKSSWEEIKDENN